MQTAKLGSPSLGRMKDSNPSITKEVQMPEHNHRHDLFRRFIGLAKEVLSLVFQILMLLKLLLDLLK